MKILVTGASRGIGLSTVITFLRNGHEVYGFDVNPSPELDSSFYHHYIVDISKPDTYPELPSIDILVNNAGIQTSDLSSNEDIITNLIGSIDITEKYGIQENIKSILFNASASALTGSEFPRYAASKGGLLAYARNTALRIAKYGATCNSICLGGVLTELNTSVMKDKEAWSQIMDLTPLSKWATPEECAQWIYFLTVENKSMTGQHLMIDNGESIKQTFVWRE